MLIYYALNITSLKVTVKPRVRNSPKKRINIIKKKKQFYKMMNLYVAPWQETPLVPIPNFYRES